MVGLLAGRPYLPARDRLPRPLSALRLTAGYQLGYAAGHNKKRRLNNPGAQHVMDMHDAGGLALVDNKQSGNTTGVHHLQRG